MQYGPDFWPGPLAASMLPIINKNKAALFCNNDSPGLLSRRAWSEAYALSKKYFIFYYQFPGSASFPVILV